MKKHIFNLFLLFVLLFSLTACGNRVDPLAEGNCRGVIAFTEMPKVLELDSDFLEHLTINVTLCNMVSEKTYHISLNQEKQFRQELSLHPGTYRVVGVYAGQIRDLGIELQASAESLTFAPDQQCVLTVTVSDPEALARRWTELQPIPEILLADKYSGLIQINRKVISIQDILPELTLTGDYSANSADSLDSFASITLTDSEKGVQVRLLNPTNSPLPLTSCTVTGITVTKNSVLFPDGVSVDSRTQEVCHSETGLYGEPAKMTGTLFFGWGMAENSAVYSDPASGNRITVNLYSNGSRIRSIDYDLAVFE